MAIVDKTFPHLSHFKSLTGSSFLLCSSVICCFSSKAKSNVLAQVSHLLSLFLLICMIFMWAFSLPVTWKDFWQDLHFISLSFPSWVLVKWNFKLLALLKHFSQYPHWYNFLGSLGLELPSVTSSSGSSFFTGWWIEICFPNFSSLLKYLLQMLHGTLFSSWTSLTWRSWFPFELNSLPHWLHVKIAVLVWTVLMCLIRFEVLNVFPQ